MEKKFGPALNPPLGRRYDLDWLRVIAFIILIFYHVGMFFNYWGWHIKNNEQSNLIQVPMYFTGRWRMSLLFMISGAGVYFALGSRSPGSFLRERFVRIFIPLLFGMLVIVPPQIYLERLTQGETYSYAEFYRSVFEFQPYPKGSFSWHHLWYLVYIFFYSLAGLPLLLFIRRNIRMTSKWAVFFQKPLALILIPVAWHVGGSALLGHRFPTTNDLIHDWNQHFHYFTLFVSGFVLCTQPAFWEILKKQRRLLLIVWLVLLPVVYYYYFSEREVTGLENIFNDLVKSTMTWCILLSFFGYAYVYLQFTNRFLRYANEAVYPFYILHQTVIICLAYPLINLPLHFWLKFGYLCVGTFGVCLVLYEFVIRRVSILGLLFGLKPKKRRKVEDQGIPAISSES
ncbi:acyltransferase family protein [Dyadobacter aurulentus]|uniref:acyltransferase family protein n=1 Tax=Dyadobacter sp. UC 10 TaxID=2605428 RepID=UPI0011F1ABFF|nr:acyltransferase family protein [Dyadobacter sp. UC 10]KAA0990812.1 acyltransferase family protein [Dyadobacter sp. UC 10]